MDFSFSDLNINSVVIDNVVMLPSIENLLGFETHAVFFLRRVPQDSRLLYIHGEWLHRVFIVKSL